MSVSKGLANSVIPHSWRGVSGILEKIGRDASYITEIKLKGKTVCAVCTYPFLHVCVKKRGLRYMQEFSTDSFLESDSV